jgi:hypothetical protein
VHQTYFVKVAPGTQYAVRQMLVRALYCDPFANFTKLRQKIVIFADADILRKVDTEAVPRLSLTF